MIESRERLCYSLHDVIKERDDIAMIGMYKFKPCGASACALWCLVIQQESASSMG
jgi:hypothetical protein